MQVPPKEMLDHFLFRMTVIKTTKVLLTKLLKNFTIFSTQHISFPESIYLSQVNIWCIISQKSTMCWLTDKGVCGGVFLGQGPTEKGNAPWVYAPQHAPTRLHTRAHVHMQEVFLI